MKEFIRIYEMLDKECYYYSHYLGHLKGLIDNDDWMRVVRGSKSGQVLSLGNTEIINALILFNTRMFDEQKDVVSLRKLGPGLRSDEDIQKFHLERMKEIGINYEVDRYCEARKEFILARRKLFKNKTELKLRDLRNYDLAHNIVCGGREDKATLNDLVEITEEVNDLVDLAGYIVKGTRSIYRDLSKKAEEKTRMLYAVLPALADLEKNYE